MTLHRRVLAEFGQHLRVGREARFGLLDRLEPQPGLFVLGLVEQDRGQLLGRVDVERAARGLHRRGLDLALEPHDLGLEPFALPVELVGVHRDAVVLELREHADQRELDVAVERAQPHRAELRAPSCRGAGG
jgi:hypothetical protein